MLYRASRLVVRPTALAIYRPTILGAGHVPRRGAVILASNHLSFIDSLVIPIAAPRQVTFLAKAEYFTGRGVSGAVRRLWMQTMGMISVDRDQAGSAQASLDAALGVLQAGGAFGIYPEGTRSRDGRLYRGHTGVAWLALTAGAPVVPVALAGTEEIQPIGSVLPRMGKVTVRFGPPLSFVDRYAGVPAGRARREVTDQVMAAIADLSGQVVVDAYNERHQGID